MISKTVKTILIIGCLVSLLIGASWVVAPRWTQAIINRTVGANLIPGDGLYLGADDPDTMHVQPGWGTIIDTDSVEANATDLADSLVGLWDIDQSIGGEKTFAGDSVIVSTGGLRTLDINCYGNLTVNTGGTVSLPADQIGNTEVAAIDSTWITTGSIGTQSIKDGGIFNEDVADYTLDSAKVTNTVVKALRETNTAPATQLSGYVLIEQGTDITITKNDSAFVIAYSGAGGRYDQFWGAEQFGINWTTDDSVAAWYWISEEFNGLTHPHFVRNINTSQTVDDQEDTVVFSGRLPTSFDQDIDSITFGFRTSTAATATSSVKWVVYAMADLNGYAPEDTLKMGGEVVASSSAGVWEWLSVPIADSSQEIGAGSYIFVYAICQMDYTTHAETVDVEPPLFWGNAK